MTQTGGLPYHGGPGSNYVTHALAAMTETLRRDPGSYGLVSGVGMHMQKHAYGVWSTTPGAPPPGDAPPVAPAGPVAPVEIVGSFEGPATVATYSVLHGRDGEPERALLICDVPGGRCYAQLEGGAAVLGAVEIEELIGRTVTLTPRSGQPRPARLRSRSARRRGRGRLPVWLARRHRSLGATAAARVDVVPGLVELADDLLSGRLAAAAIDIPIGLPASGSRPADVAARRRLGAAAELRLPGPGTRRARRTDLSRGLRDLAPHLGQGSRSSSSTSWTRSTTSTTSSRPSSSATSSRCAPS